MSALARQMIATIRRENNQPETIRARVADDVALASDPWHELGLDPTGDMTTEAMRAMIARDIEADQASIADARQFMDVFRATPAGLPQQLPPAPAPLPQPLVNEWHNGPAVQAAPQRVLSGGHRADGRASGHQPNGVYINGPRQHYGSNGGNNGGNNGGRGFSGRGTQRARVRYTAQSLSQLPSHRRQFSHGPRGGPGRYHHNARPYQSSQLQNGYVPGEDDTDVE
ncbi:MAG: hypothetical protein Q9226_006074 [Calogaya cf. arnoldii]